MARKNESLKASTKDGLVYIIVSNDGTGTQTLLDQLADHKKRIEVAAPTAEGVHYVLADIPTLGPNGFADDQPGGPNI